MTELDVTTLWIGMLNKLKETIPPNLYTIWIESSIIPYSYENNILILDTSQKFLCSYLSNNYLDDLKKAAFSVTGVPTTVKLICSAKESPDTTTPSKTVDKSDLQPIPKQVKETHTDFELVPVNMTLSTSEKKRKRHHYQ